MIFYKIRNLQVCNQKLYYQQISRYSNNNSNKFKHKKLIIKMIKIKYLKNKSTVQNIHRYVIIF